MTAKEVYTTFNTGDRIRVVRCNSYKKYDYTGLFGTVVSNQSMTYSNIVVELDTATNPYSGTSRFYFRPNELELVRECDNDILEEHNMQNVTNYFNIVRIRYLDNNTPSRWDYANFDCGLKVGDLCVVRSAHHGLGLARVTEIIDQTNLEVTREIVARVDTELYDFRVAARNEAAELKAKMQERAKKLQDIALYQMLAKDDPEMQNMLERYQNIPQY